MRIGLLETMNFCLEFFPTVKSETFLQESAGVADLITSCKSCAGLVVGLVVVAVVAVRSLSDRV